MESAEDMDKLNRQKLDEASKLAEYRYFFICKKESERDHNFYEFP